MVTGLQGPCEREGDNVRSWCVIFPHASVTPVFLEEFVCLDVENSLRVSTAN